MYCVILMCTASAQNALTLLRNDHRSYRENPCIYLHIYMYMYICMHIYICIYLYISIFDHSSLTSFIDIFGMVDDTSHCEWV